MGDARQADAQDPAGRRGRRRRLAGIGATLLAEALGTALLVGVGLSVVIADFGHGSPIIAWIPSVGIRRAVTGFLFGCTGALIALSALGRRSGAHINPIVTLTFVVTRAMRAWHGAGYVLAQLCGAALGAYPLLAWGRTGESVAFGATTPGPGYGARAALAGEVATTFTMVLLLMVFLRSRRLRRFTPGLFPPLYALMVFLEAPVSGTSTNPARSFGPALISWVWSGFWIYCVGPALGALLAIAALRLPGLHWAEIEVAKLYHFDHDPHALFHRKTRRR